MKCLFCGKEFELTRANKKYCSEKCRHAASHLQHGKVWYRSNREVVLYQHKYKDFFGRWLRIEVARKYCRKGNA